MPPDPQPPHDEQDALPVERVLDLLRQGELELHGILPWSSNYTYLASVHDGELEAMAVYKPRRGERPLWDFPRGTLYLREYAAYLVSQVLGWPLVPPTVVRDGPQGMGALQLYIDNDPQANYFTFRDERIEDVQRIAAFDLVVNNADRKAGHCLLGRDGHVWAIDHGITFHPEPKLRTVIWEFTGQPIPPPLLDDLRRLCLRLQPAEPLSGVLKRLLLPEEIHALRDRLDTLLSDRTFPEPDTIPWPPV
jgi:uncharacterized repeat protein (TIGR03843 family)